MAVTKKVMEIVIPENVSAKIEAAQYNYETRQDLCAFMIGREMDTSGIAFQRYESELVDYKVEFELLKREMYKTYLEPEVNGNITNWNLDFYTHTVTVYYTENDEQSEHDSPSATEEG